MAACFDVKGIAIGQFVQNIYITSVFGDFILGFIAIKIITFQATVQFYITLQHV